LLQLVFLSLDPIECDPCPGHPVESLLTFQEGRCAHFCRSDTDMLLYVSYTAVSTNVIQWSGIIPLGSSEVASTPLIIIWAGVFNKVSQSTSNCRVFGLLIMVLNGNWASSTFIAVMGRVNTSRFCIRSDFCGVMPNYELHIFRQSKTKVKNTSLESVCSFFSPVMRLCIPCIAARR
jgi:hypothetical protein